MVVGSYGVGQMTVSDGVLLARSVNVGDSGPPSNTTSSVGMLMIAGGTTAVASDIAAAVFSNANGLIQVSGGFLSVTNQSSSGQIVVGQQGSGSLSQGGGVIIVDRLTVGGGGSNVVFGISTNVITGAGLGQTILSGGLFTTRTLEIGLGAKSQGTLTVDGGSISVASNAVIGVATNGVGVLQIVNGALFVTNQTGTAQLVVGQQGQGNFGQSGGASTVDSLLVRNFTNSVFHLNSGLFNTKSTIVSNSQVFAVGDGVNTATYHLLGGIHAFSKGIRIRNNATLSGCGTIIANVLVDAGGTVLTDCGGTLTFAGIVTNNGSMIAVSGGTLESYDTVVNNGVIDVIDGQTNFHAGFLNNGVVLTADDIPRIISITLAGSDVGVNFTTFSNLTHVVEYTSDIVSQSWTTLLSLTGSGGMTNATDPGAAVLTQRFYRIHLEVPP